MARAVIISSIALLAALFISFSVMYAVHTRQAVERLESQLAALAKDDGGPVPRPNVGTAFNDSVDTPKLSASAWHDPMAVVIGNVEISNRVYIGPFASIRGDEGQPIFVGEDSNLQDGVVIHALETESDGKEVEGRTYQVGSDSYAVYIGERVSVAHQALVHGPARVDDDVFIGMQAMVFKARIGSGSVVEPGAKVIGVSVASGRYVPAGTVLTDQAAADALPSIDESYAYAKLNEAVVHVNTSLAVGYADAGKPKTKSKAKSKKAEKAPAAEH